MGGLASALGSGFSQLFKGWGKGIGKAVDNFLLDKEARKAINDEVVSKFQPKIDLFNKAASRRADNIKDLGDKLAQSKKALADAQTKWQQDYDSALAGAKAQRQTDIDAYKAQSKAYQDAVNNAKAGKQSIIDQLKDSESSYNKFKTIFTDVNTGRQYVFDPSTGKQVDLSTYYTKLKPKDQRAILDYDNRLYDSNTGRVLNAFDESTKKTYKDKGYSAFDNYYSNKISTQNAALRDAENKLKLANSDLSAWKKNSSIPTALDEKQFLKNYKKTNGSSPNEYSFNGQNYSKVEELDKAYQDALAFEQGIQKRAKGKASTYASERDAEIAKRIQDAKDIKKAKLALGAGAGIGALYAGAKAMYGGDDTDTTDSIDNTDNTYTGKPDPAFNVEKEGQAILKDELPMQQQIDTGFDPDKAKAVLADAAYDKGIEDGSSVKASDIVAADGNSIDDGLFELLKAMKDPYKADAIANYIYSRHGNDPEVQNRGWRAWLNRYGDSLRSKMGIDPSGYKGMHVSGGL